MFIHTSTKCVASRTLFEYKNISKLVDWPQKNHRNNSNEEIKEAAASLNLCNVSANKILTVVIFISNVYKETEQLVFNTACLFHCFMNTCG